MAQAPISTFLIKVTNECNFDCDHCYFRNQADKSYQKRPSIISDKIIDQFAARLSEYVETAQLDTVDIVFHGGEPLLLPPELYKRTVSSIRRTLPSSCFPSFSVQSNGSLVNEKWIECLHENEISLAISIDGDLEAQNRHRLRKGGQSSFSAVMDGLTLLNQHPLGNSLLDGILAVIDLRNDPTSVYQFHKVMGVAKLDYLLPDGTHNNPPPGITDYLTDTNYANWLEAIFDEWYNDGSGYPSIRFFENIIALLIGGESATEGIGPGDLTVLTIHTDGEIQDSDVFSITYENAGRFGEGAYLGSTSFIELLESIEFQNAAKRYSKESLCQKCRDCEWESICAGGFIQHRYIGGTNFLAPSVYCANLSHLINHIFITISREVDRAIQESQSSLRDSAASANYIEDAQRFIRDWDCRKPEGSAYLYRYELGQKEGGQWHPHRRILTNNDIEFLEVIEGGVSLLVEMLTREMGLITYTSCEGHQIDASRFHLRNVGILPRDNTELAFICGLVTEIAESVNDTADNLVEVEVGQDVLEDEYQKYETIEIRFIPKTELNTNQYFLLLEDVYSSFLSALAEKMSILHLPQSGGS